MKDAERYQLGYHKKRARKRKKWDKRMVHKLVRDIARQMAGAYYEHAAHDNQFYAYYPSQKFFVDYEWFRFVTVAKQTMTQMLTSNAISEAQKQEIYHALLLDSTLPYAQAETQIVNIPN